MFKTSKQKMVGKYTTTEAELIAVSDRTNDTLRAQRFLEAQGYPMIPPVVLQDNQSVITLFTKGGVKPARTRHLGVRRAIMQELVEERLLAVKYCPTDRMRAGGFTKLKQGQAYKEHRDVLTKQHT